MAVDAEIASIERRMADTKGEYWHSSETQERYRVLLEARAGLARRNLRAASFIVPFLRCSSRTTAVNQHHAYSILEHPQRDF